MSKTEPQQPVNPSAGKSEDFTVPRFLGLTKREYFAAKALEGFTASPEFETDEVAAKHAVERADALIEELNKD